MNNNFLSSIPYQTFKLVLFGSIYKLWILQFSTAIVGTDKTTLTQCCMQNQAQVVCSVGQSVAENIFDIFNQYLAVSKYFGCFTDLVAQEATHWTMNWKFRTSNPDQDISFLSISHTVCLCHDNKYFTISIDFFLHVRSVRLPNKYMLLKWQGVTYIRVPHTGPRTTVQTPQDNPLNDTFVQVQKYSAVNTFRPF